MLREDPSSPLSFREHRHRHVAKVATGYEADPQVERARRTFLVFLVIAGVLEFAGVTITSANLAIVTAQVKRPWVIEFAFWMVFLYTLIVYYIAARTDIELFRITKSPRKTFFVFIARSELEHRLTQASGRGGATVQWAAGDIPDDAGKTVVIGRLPQLPDGTVERIEGYDAATNRFTYMHQPGDEKLYVELSGVIPFALKYNYLVYVLPVDLAALLIGYKLSDLAVYPLAWWLIR